MTPILNCSDCSSTTPALLFVDFPCVSLTSSRSDTRYHDNDDDDDCDDDNDFFVGHLKVRQQNLDRFDYFPKTHKSGWEQTKIPNSTF